MLAAAAVVRRGSAVDALVNPRTRVGGDLWLGDIRRYLGENLSRLRSVWLLTVTAPGSDVLIDQEHVVEWNRTAGARYSEMHRQAVQAVQRRGHRVFVAARVWQVQKRGALHVHPVVAYGDRDKVGAWLYAQELKRLAPSFGFGFVDARNAGHGSTVMEGRKAGWYLSKYLGESAQLVGALGKVARPVWVARWLTDLTGCTMRRLRRVRFLWWIRRGESSVVALAGSLPRWLGDRYEYGLVNELVRAGP